MTKVFVLMKFKNDMEDISFKAKGLLSKQSLIYTISDHTKFKLNLTDSYFIKEDAESLLYLSYNDHPYLKYTLKENNFVFKEVIEILYKSLTANSFKIMYLFNKQKFCYEVSWKVET
ncbi:MAG: hypothetical protein RSE91_04295 [Bacilli bacterium]